MGPIMPKVPGNTTGIQANVTIASAVGQATSVTLTAGGAITLPANESPVSIPANSTSAAFAFNTNAVTQPTVGTITSQISGGAPQTISFSVQPSSLVAVTLNPRSVRGRGTSNGLVRLSSPAAAGGANVELSSNSPVATVPSSVTVPAGSDSAGFVVQTKAVLHSTQATIRATYAGVTRSAKLTVTP
jgi:hypothetical protein